jgi:hypothetical protein
MTWPGIKPVASSIDDKVNNKVNDKVSDKVSNKVSHYSIYIYKGELQDLCSRGFLEGKR